MTENATASRESSGTIPVTGVPYRGARGFATLLVDQRGAEIVLDVQVTRLHDHP